MLPFIFHFSLFFLRCANRHSSFIFKINPFFFQFFVQKGITFQSFSYLCNWFGEKSGLTKKHLLLFRVKPKCPGNSLE